MSLPTSRNKGNETGNDRVHTNGGHKSYSAHAAATSDETSDFFTDDPSEYIDSTTILPASESREQLSHFFDETILTAPAENTEFIEQEITPNKYEPENFGETQVGKFFKKLFAKTSMRGQ